MAEKSTVSYEYATAVFFNHSKNGVLINKQDIPNFTNTTSHIVVYITTNKLHNQVFEKTRDHLNRSVSDDRCTRQVVLDIRANDKASSPTSNLFLQTKQFLQMYEQFIYEELSSHSINPRKDEDVFQYLSRFVIRDEVHVKGWKNRGSSKANEEESGKSSSKVVTTVSRKLHALKYDVELDIDEEVDAAYETLNNKGKKGKDDEFKEVTNRCGKYLKKKQLGNFIKVEIDKGNITCNCETFMRLGFCPEAALFTLLCKQEPPNEDCIAADGVQWTGNIRDSLIRKFQTRLFEKTKSNKDQDKHILKYSQICPRVDPQMEDGHMVGRVHQFDNSSMLDAQK